MFPANQVIKFCIGGENLDTKLQVLPLPKTYRVSAYNNVRFIRSFESNIMLNYDNSLRSSAEDTNKNKIVATSQRHFEENKTCNYYYNSSARASGILVHFLGTVVLCKHQIIRQVHVVKNFKTICI